MAWGNAKGEVASAESVDLVLSWVKRSRKTLDAFAAAPTEEKSGQVRRLLESAVQSACYMVSAWANSTPAEGHVEHPVFLAGGFQQGLHRPGR